MRQPKSVAALDELGRVRLSKSFYMREFLYSEAANFHGIPNMPDNPELAIRAGTLLCEQLLEPLHDTFGKVIVRSGFRSCGVNGFCNARQRAGKTGYTSACNEANYAGHIWDRRDAEGCMGATACVLIPWFADRYDKGADWRSLAWWIHDHLPYSHLHFFPRGAAFNIGWREIPLKQIKSYVAPRGTLTKRGMKNQTISHARWYKGFPERRASSEPWPSS